MYNTFEIIYNTLFFWKIGKPHKNNISFGFCEQKHLCMVLNLNLIYIYVYTYVIKNFYNKIFMTFGGNQIGNFVAFLNFHQISIMIFKNLGNIKKHPFKKTGVIIHFLPSFLIKIHYIRVIYESKKNNNNNKRMPQFCPLLCKEKVR